jgi:hypothetical protein
MPELKGEEDLHEFLNIHIRQWDYILYYPYHIFLPQVIKNGGLISIDDTSLDKLRIRDLKYHLELDEKGKSLLPLRKSELENSFQMSMIEKSLIEAEHFTQIF